MKMWLKCVCLAVLVAAAGFSAFSALRSITDSAPDRAPDYDYEWSCSMEDAQFVLREHDGLIGIFSPVDRRSPVSITDIEVSCLRETDRQMLRSGIAVADKSELLLLLEDFGS